VVRIDPRSRPWRAEGERRGLGLLQQHALSRASLYEFAGQHDTVVALAKIPELRYVDYYMNERS
jgi:hypothetical protein